MINFASRYCINKIYSYYNMASVKAKFRASSVDAREGRIYYQIIHERKTRQIVTDYRIYDSEWDEERGELKNAVEGSRIDYLASVRERIKCDLGRFDRIVNRLAVRGGAYTADDMVKEFCSSLSRSTLFNELEKSIARLTQYGRTRTAQTYASALRSIRRYREDEDIPLECLTTEVMEGYQAWLQQQGSAPNTVSFYFRILRAVYNRAVDDGLTENRRPFRHVYTGVDKTVKRGLPLPTMKKIKGLDLSLTPDMEYARDMFLLSFMLRGMSFIDMALLKKTDLNHGHVVYRRRKTRQQLSVAWTPEMQKILDRYPKNETDYLLPIIRKTTANERCLLKNTGEKINRRLKAIGEMVGLSIPLTMYVARHSWATIARSRGVPLSVISEGLGHEKESTTRIYLASLDSTAVDKANKMILKLL